MRQRSATRNRSQSRTTRGAGPEPGSDIASVAPALQLLRGSARVPAPGLLALQQAAGNHRVLTAERGPATKNPPHGVAPTVQRKPPVKGWTEEQWQRVKDAVTVFAYSDPDAVGRIADAWHTKEKGSKPEADPKELLAGKPGSLTGKAQVSGGVGGGGYAGARAAKVDLQRLGTAYEVLAEAGVVGGVELRLTGELEAKLGKRLTAKAQATFKAFAGFYAHARATAFARKGEKWWDFGAGTSARAETQFGAKAGGDLTTTVTLDQLNLGAELLTFGEAFAGGEAEAEVEAIIDPKAREIAAGGKFAAFAGARATAAVSGSALLYGRKAITTRFEPGVAAGAGTSAIATFKLSRGVLRISYGGDLTVGVGGGATHDAAVDFKPITVLIVRQAHQGLWEVKQMSGFGDVNRLLSEPTLVRGKLVTELREYRDLKQRQLANQRADEFVKIEKVQKIIDTHLPRHHIKGRSDAATIDTFIKSLVMTECSLPDAQVTVEVSNGKLTSLTLTPTDAVKKLKGEKPDATARAKLAEVGK